MDHPKSTNSYLQVSEYCARSVLRDLHKQILTDISFIEKSEDKINGYSSNRVINLVNEIGNQISTGPRTNDPMPNPKEIPNIKQDNLTGVQKIEQRFIKRRGRSKTKFGFRSHKSSFSLNSENGFKITKKQTFQKNASKFQANPVIEKDNDDSSSEISNKEQILKNHQSTVIQSQKKINQGIPKKKKPQYLRYRQFSYHDGEIIQLNKVVPENWTVKKDRLLSSIAKASIIKARNKSEPVQSQRIETHKISREESKKKKPKKVSKVLQKVKEPKQLSVEEPIVVEFSDISDLSQRFDCAPGVSFIDGRYIYRNKAVTLASQSLQPSQRRYSKRQFHELRSKSSMQNQLNSTYTGNHTISHDKHDYYDQISHRQSILSNLNKKKKKQSQKIIVHDPEIVSDFLIKEDHQDEEKNVSKKNQQYQRDPNKKIPQICMLSNVDRFNIEYIRNSVHKKKPKYYHHHNNNNPKLLLKPQTNNQLKNPLMNNRVKLKNKGSIISALKQKFEQNLRHKRESN